MASTLAAALDFVEEAAQALLRRAPGSLVGAVVDPVDLGAPAAAGGDGHGHGGGSPSASGTFLAGVAALRWKARAFPASPEALRRSVSRMPVPERPEDLTLGWMRAALVRAGLLAAPDDLAAMEVAPVGAPGLLSEVMRVTLTLAAGASDPATGDGRPCPPSVIVKMPTVVAENRELAEDSNCYELVSDETRAGAGRRLTGGLAPPRQEGNFFAELSDVISASRVIDLPRCYRENIHGREGRGGRLTEKHRRRHRPGPGPVRHFARGPAEPGSGNEVHVPGARRGEGAEESSGRTDAMAAVRPNRWKAWQVSAPAWPAGPAGPAGRGG